MRVALLSFLVAGCSHAAPSDPPCAEGDPSPWFCVQIENPTGPSCGDVRMEPFCVDGAWRCPYSNLYPDREHRCVCFDGPRPRTQHCECGDGGTVTCEFECGDARCDLETEYCAITASDVGGPDSFACAPFVSPCAGSLPCECVAAGALECTEEVGAVTAHYPGG